MGTELIPFIRVSMDVLSFIAVLVIGIYSWVLNRTKANKEAIQNLDRDVRGISERMERTEAALRFMPSQQDFGGIHEKVNHVDSTVSTLTGEVSAMRQTLNLIHQSLLDERNKSK